MGNKVDVGKCRIRILNDEERVASFDCGKADLNDYIVNDAADFQKELLAVNYVMEKDSDLCAFFSLLSDRICLYDFDSKTEFNRFRSKRFIQPYRFKGYPAIKIGRFGVKDSYKEQGIGSALLDFIKTYFLRNRRLGCRFLTVDAYKDAIPFYAKNGFIKLRSDSDRETSLMYYDLKACAVKHIKKVKKT